MPLCSMFYSVFGFLQLLIRIGHLNDVPGLLVIKKMRIIVDALDRYMVLCMSCAAEHIFGS